MQTLNEIIADLKDIAISNNYEGATVDGLIYLMASGIYKNQLNVVNTAREVSPSSCTLVNSAIQHAQDKNYSVYRGRNQHILIKYATPIETKQVKKFDVCTRIGKYLLVYARDYTFESGTRFNGDIELILCEKLIEETLSSSLKKYTRSSTSDLTEDLAFYVNDKESEYVNNLNISLTENNYINQTCDTPYLILTDTDYGVICWSYDNINDTIFDTNFTYKIKSPEYLTECIEEDAIQSIPGFDITKTLENTNGRGNEDGITLLTNLVREENVDNIYIESSAAEHAGNIIRSIDDIKSIFLNYFAMANIKSCKCYLTKAKIQIIYLLEDKNKQIPNMDIEAFQRYLAKAYYVTQEIEIRKAWGFKHGYNIPFEYEKETVEYCKVKLIFETKDLFKEIDYEVEKNTLFELPNNDYAFSDDNKKFIGWKFKDDPDGYAITGKDSNQAKILVTEDVILKMVCDTENTRFKYVDIYSEADIITSLEDKYFYQRICLFPKENNEYRLSYEPEKPIKKNHTFANWVDTSTGNTFNKLLNNKITEDIVTYVAYWNEITYSVQIVLLNKEMHEQYITNGNYSADIIKNQTVLSGDVLDISQITTPADLNALNYHLAGLYYVDPDNNRLKFDYGTPILKDGLKLYAFYESDYNLDMEIYFESPLNNTELHSFVDEYSYDIGETFEPMKILTQMSKKYDGISWIDLRTSKEPIEIEPDSYFDFSYNISFNNNTGR